MQIRVVTLGRRTARKHSAADDLFVHYCSRAGNYVRFAAETFITEEKFLASLERAAQRSRPLLVLLDGRGKSWSTEQFAAWLEEQRNQGAQNVIFAVGPANGWSETAYSRAHLLLSLGPMTLPHELAAVVLAEQIYRAFTIIEGHPYHLGHVSE